MRTLWILALLACAPTVDTPAERARIADREDATRLAAQLRTLPGVIAAEVMLRRSLPPALPGCAALPTRECGGRSLRDPLTNAAPAPYASAAIVVDNPVYQSATIASATRLVRAAVPEVSRPEIVVEVVAPRPAMARVGPFQVAVSTRPRLIATLIACLLLIATLAGYIAWRARLHAA